MIWLTFLGGVNHLVFGQTVTGTVTDPDGQPAIGAGVVCREKPAAGTVADIDGRFSLKIPEGVRTLVFSCIGMEDFVYDITKAP